MFELLLALIKNHSSKFIGLVPVDAIEEYKEILGGVDVRGARFI
jgi:hypothetical protein